jgi:hypothetical protein
MAKKIEKEHPKTITFLGVPLTLARKNNSKVRDSDLEDSLVYKNDKFKDVGFTIRVICFEPNRPALAYYDCL